MTRHKKAHAPLLIPLTPAALQPLPGIALPRKFASSAWREQPVIVCFVTAPIYLTNTVLMFTNSLIP
jgi:hypothetical protein